MTSSNVGTNHFFLTVSFLVLSTIHTLLALIPPTLHGKLYLVFLLMITGQQIIDLYGNDPTDFPTLGDQWLLSGMSTPPKTITDSGTIYLGGLNINSPSNYFERTYSSLPSHITIYYDIAVTVFGTWVTTDALNIYFDDGFVSSWNDFPISNLAPDADGYGPSGPQKFNIVGSKSHSASSLKIKILSNFVTSANTASFAIRDIIVLLSTAANSDPKGTCTKHVMHSNSCSCQPGNYAHNVNGCTTCNSACEECFGGASNQCYACKVNKYYDGIQCTNCDPSCKYCSGPNVNQCTVCNSGNFLYWDNTCRSSCNAPYITAGTGEYKECRSPCQATSKYMLWNNTCADSCDPPLLAAIQGQAKLCNYVCNNANNEFLFWNGSCSTSCPFYQRNENGYRFCDACQAGYYMYPDSQCLPSCPLVYQRNVNGSSFCDFPCVGEKKYYDTSNKICKSECKYPYQIQENVLCSLNLQQDQVEEAKTVSGALSGGSKAANTFANVGSLFSSGNPAAFLLVSLTEMLQYIKFMKINYPPKLQQILDFDEGNFNFIPELPEEAADSFQRHTLPDNFEKYELPSSFLINFWQQTIMLSIVMLVIFVVVIVKHYIKRFKFVNTVTGKIKHILKWNFALALFTSYYGNIIFYSSLEFRTAYIDSFPPALSLFLCILMNLLAFAIFAKMIIVIKAIRKPEIIANNSGRSRRLVMIKSNMREYEVLFESCKEDSFIKQAFMPIYVLRLVLFNLFIGYLFEYPLAQAILISLLSISMFLYLAITRPQKLKIDLVQYLIQEFIIMTVCVCTLVLAILDSIGTEAHDARTTLGDIIIYANLAFSSISLAYMLLQTLILLKHFYNILKDVYKRRKNKANFQKNSKITPQRDVSNDILTANLTSSDLESKQHSFQRPKKLSFEMNNSRMLTTQGPLSHKNSGDAPSIFLSPPSPTFHGEEVDRSNSFVGLKPLNILTDEEYEKAAKTKGFDSQPNLRESSKQEKLAYLIDQNSQGITVQNVTLRELERFKRSQRIGNVESQDNIEEIPAGAEDLTSGKNKQKDRVFDAKYWINRE